MSVIVISAILVVSIERDAETGFGYIFHAFGVKTSAPKLEILIQSDILEQPFLVTVTAYEPF